MNDNAGSVNREKKKKVTIQASFESRVERIPDKLLLNAKQIPKENQILNFIESDKSYSVLGYRQTESYKTSTCHKTLN